MHKLIRRISNSFFSRPDRPWSEDATSTAPQIGRKRRLSSTEPEDDGPLASISKRYRAAPVQVDPEEAQLEETEGVKEVTKGVQEVELEEGEKVVTDRPSDGVAVDAAAIPLPDSPVLDACEDTEETPVEDALKGDATSEESVVRKADEEPVVATNEVAEGPAQVNEAHVEEREEGATTSSGEDATVNVEAANGSASVETKDTTTPVEENIPEDIQTKDLHEEKTAQVL